MAETALTPRLDRLAQRDRLVGRDLTDMGEHARRSGSSLHADLGDPHLLGEGEGVELAVRAAAEDAVARLGLPRHLTAQRRLRHRLLGIEGRDNGDEGAGRAGLGGHGMRLLCVGAARPGPLGPASRGLGAAPVARPCLAGLCLSGP